MSRSAAQRLQQQQLLVQQQQAMADNEAAALAAEMFDLMCGATTMRQVLGLYRNMCDTIGLHPAPLNEFYPKLKTKIRSWKAQALWKKFDARAAHRVYNKGNACTETRVLVIGAGPCGLRTAIEAQLLGAKVVVVEKRDRISRNNVLHLWPFVITDLRNLGAKKFYGKFCAGSIDHISIRQLQCMLLKVALLLGVEVHEGVSFEDIVEPTEGCGWRSKVSPEDHAVSHYEFDVLIGADGKRNTLEGFKRKEFRGKLAIAITANFINKKTEAEAKAEEISGVAFIFNQSFFKELYQTTGIDLENIVYYKDETHYFVMTAKKHSLIDKGVIMQDFADPAELLAPANVNTEKLLDYAREAANFSTKYQMPNLEFAVNHYGKPDVAMFDFTSMFQAEASCRVTVRKNYRLLQCLVGDSLLEPFWPTGSGCARGFLSSMDAAYAIKLWNNSRNSILGVVAQRESIYRLLAQTTPENLQRDTGAYTVDPATRYPNLNRATVNVWQVKHLLDSDDPQILEQTFMDTNAITTVPETPIRRKRRTGDMLPLSAVLLRWIKAQLHSHEFTQKLNEVSDCFTNGKVLCALINRYRPDLVDLTKIKYSSPVEANEIAFNILQKELRIPRVMSAEDSINLEKVDSKIWLNYLEQICDVFRGEIPHVKHPKLDVAEFRQKPDNKAQDFSKLLKLNSKKAKSPMNEIDVTNVISRRSVLDEDKMKRQRIKYAAGSDLGQVDSPRRAKKRRSAEKSSNIDRERGIPSALPREVDEQFSNRIRNMEQRISSRNAGRSDKKPRDLMRAIGKIDSSDWNVREIEKKIEQSKKTEVGNKGKEKVPKWSKEQFLARQHKMAKPERQESVEEKFKEIDLTLKNLDKQLKEGRNLEVGERGKNKVASIADQFVKKDDTSEEKNLPSLTKTSSKVAQAFKKQSASEKCHFCKQTVYLMEKISTEGLVLHRSCLKCHHCHTNLRMGGYAFDRDDPTGKFYCTQHFKLPAKAIRPVVRKSANKKPTAADATNTAGADGFKTPDKPRGRTDNVAQLDLLDRGQTPERIEFENADAMSDGEPSLENIIDENEWTDRNFLSDSEESDSDLSSSDDSDDESESDIFEEANDSPIGVQTLQLANDWIGKQRYSNVNSDDSDGDFYDSSEGFLDGDNDDSQTEGEEFKKAREMRREEVRLLPIPTNLPTDTETEVVSNADNLLNNKKNNIENLNISTITLASDESSAKNDFDKSSAKSLHSENNNSVINAVALKAEIEKIERKLDRKVSNEVDAMNEQIYNMNNILKLTKDVENMKKENLVKSDIMRKLSMKEKWLSDSNAGNMISKKEDSKQDQTGKDMQTKNPDNMKIQDILEIVKNVDLNTKTEHQLKANGSTENMSTNDMGKHLYDIENKFSPKGTRKMNEKLKEIESRNFADTMDTIKSQIVTPTISKQSSVDLAKYFPNQKAEKSGSGAINKNQKTLKDVDLAKYFPSSPVVARKVVTVADKLKRSQTEKVVAKEPTKPKTTVPASSTKGAGSAPNRTLPQRQHSLNIASTSKKGSTDSLIEQLDGAAEVKKPAKKIIRIIKKIPRKKKAEALISTSPVKNLTEEDRLLDEILKENETRSPSIEYQRLFQEEKSPSEDVSDKIEKILEKTGIDLGIPKKDKKKQLTKAKSFGENEFKQSRDDLDFVKEDGDIPTGVQGILKRFESFSSIKSDELPKWRKIETGSKTSITKSIESFQSRDSLNSGNSFQSRDSLHSKSSFHSKNLNSSKDSFKSRKDSIDSKESISDCVSDFEKTMEYLKSGWKTEATNFLQKKRDSFYAKKKDSDDERKEKAAEDEKRKKLEEDEVNRNKFKFSKYFFAKKDKSPLKSKEKTPEKKATKNLIKPKTKVVEKPKATPKSPTAQQKAAGNQGQLKKLTPEKKSDTKNDNKKITTTSQASKIIGGKTSESRDSNEGKPYPIKRSPKTLRAKKIDPIAKKTDLDKPAEILKLKENHKNSEDVLKLDKGTEDTNLDEIFEEMVNELQIDITPNDVSDDNTSSKTPIRISESPKKEKDSHYESNLVGTSVQDMSVVREDKSLETTKVNVNVTNTQQLSSPPKSQVLRKEIILEKSYEVPQLLEPLKMSAQIFVPTIEKAPEQAPRIATLFVENNSPKNSPPKSENIILIENCVPCVSNDEKEKNIREEIKSTNYAEPLKISQKISTSIIENLPESQLRKSPTKMYSEIVTLNSDGVFKSSDVSSMPINVEVVPQEYLKQSNYLGKVKLTSKMSPQVSENVLRQPLKTEQSSSINISIDKSLPKDHIKYLESDKNSGKLSQPVVKNDFDPNVTTERSSPIRSSYKPLLKTEKPIESYVDKALGIANKNSTDSGQKSVKKVSDPNVRSPSPKMPPTKSPPKIEKKIESPVVRAQCLVPVKENSYDSVQQPYKNMSDLVLTTERSSSAKFSPNKSLSKNEKPIESYVVKAQRLDKSNNNSSDSDQQPSTKLDALKLARNNLENSNRQWSIDSNRSMSLLSDLKTELLNTNNDVAQEKPCLDQLSEPKEKSLSSSLSRSPSVQPVTVYIKSSGEEDSIEKLFDQFSDDMLVDVEFDSADDLIAIIPRAVLTKDKSPLKEELTFPQKPLRRQKSSTSSSVSPTAPQRSKKFLAKANVAPSVQDMMSKTSPNENQNMHYVSIENPKCIKFPTRSNYDDLIENDTNDKDRKDSLTSVDSSKKSASLTINTPTRETESDHDNFVWVDNPSPKFSSPVNQKESSYTSFHWGDSESPKPKSPIRTVLSPPKNNQDSNKTSVDLYVKDAIEKTQVGNEVFNHTSEQSTSETIDKGENVPSEKVQYFVTPNKGFEKREKSKRELFLEDLMPGKLDDSELVTYSNIPSPPPRRSELLEKVLNSAPIETPRKSVENVSKHLEESEIIENKLKIESNNNFNNARPKPTFDDNSLDSFHSTMENPYDNLSLQNELTDSQLLAKVKRDSITPPSSGTQSSLYDNMSSNRPSRIKTPNEKDVDLGTKLLLERSKRLHNKKLDFMDEKIAGNNPYMKRVIDQEKVTRDQDDVDISLESYRPKNHNTSRRHFPTSRAIEDRRFEKRYGSGSAKSYGLTDSTRRSAVTTPQTYSSHTSSSPRHFVEYFKRSPSSATHKDREQSKDSCVIS